MDIEPLEDVEDLRITKLPKLKDKNLSKHELNKMPLEEHLSKMGRKMYE